LPCYDLGRRREIDGCKSLPKLSKNQIEKSPKSRSNLKILKNKRKEGCHGFI
jgi:hypothetical protein